MEHNLSDPLAALEYLDANATCGCGQKPCLGQQAIDTLRRHLTSGQAVRSERVARGKS